MHDRVWLTYNRISIVVRILISILIIGITVFTDLILNFIILIS